ncbi:MAG: hypothetical protein K0U93_16070 [Gammaproteobacteria bacterium]|nr:hypothetical protein [Gammaproteobacteria bacterium]
MAAFLIVRATVADPKDRRPFDEWYENEHLPDARKAFNAQAAWRGWSEVEPQTHYAFYEFVDLNAANAIADSQEIKSLIAEFDAKWQGRVTRTRDIVERLQSI